MRKPVLATVLRVQIDANTDVKQYVLNVKFLNTLGNTIKERNPVTTISGPVSCRNSICT